MARSVLLVASWIFYIFWSWKFFLLFLASVVANYWISVGVQKRPDKWLFTLGMAINLGLLFLFKYVTFENSEYIRSLLSKFHLNWHLENIVLPLGISFYTISKITYLVDSYKGHIRTPAFRDYALFVSFFPHLIAGPILYHKEIIPQFYKRETYYFNYQNISMGLFIFIVGLNKKVIIADWLGTWVRPVFGNPFQLGFVETWGGSIAFAFQLYFDFSGYSDMASGLAKMFNIEFPINFNAPYQSANFIEFWRRWHMSLSQFLRNYIYIPLGGNRKGELRQYFNVMATMLIAGFWHGAGWHFLLWGGLHGFFICFNHWWEKHVRVPVYKPLAIFITFICTVFTWAFFKVHSSWDVVHFIKGMSMQKGFYNIHKDLFPNAGIRYLTFLALYIFIQLTPELSDAIRAKFSKSVLHWSWGIGAGIIFALALFFITTRSEFLYFQF